MKAQSQKILTLALLATLSLMMTACGSAKQSSSGSDDLASRSTGSDVTQSANKFAYCNAGSATNFKANIMAYMDTAGNVRYDYMKVKWTTIPSHFSNEATYFNMWRWKANSSGQTYIDPTPVEFRLEYIATGNPVTGWRNNLSWTELKSIAAKHNFSNALDLFKYVRAVVNIKDTAGEYDVLKIALYNKSNNTLVEQMDVLMPIFSANPSDYAVESNGASRPSVLRNLHPYNSMQSQGWSTSHYVSLANSNCF